MEKPSSGLRPIALEYLFEGMLLEEDIYSHDRRVLLLSKGNILTMKRLEQLKHYNENNRNVCVFEKTYQVLMGRGLSPDTPMSQKQLEAKAGYTKIKEKTAELFERVQRTQQVSRQETDSISRDISKRLELTNPALIFQCINAPNPIDEYLCRHSVNVGLLNGLIGRWLGIDRREIDLLILAGLIHDVGKTKISPGILNAPRKLSPQEFELIKLHPVYSYELLGPNNMFPEVVKLAARHHHEKMNGSGYPDRLTGDQIPLFAKITSVSDIYDAMISKRVYKDPADPFAVLSLLKKNQFSELDMRIVKVFIEYMPGELLEKPVLLTDGSIGTVKYIIPDDLEHPLVEVNGEIRQLGPGLQCLRLIIEE